MKNYLILIVFLLISVSLAVGQNNATDLDQIFGDRGEVYFRFRDPGDESLLRLTRQISVDDRREGLVYAYASRNEFLDFLRWDIGYELLRHPGDLDFEPLMRDVVDIRDVTDWNFYPTYDGYLSIMEQFEANHPGLCQVFSIGQSIEGREIMMAKISDNVNAGEGEPQFLYTSSMHGDELTGYVLMLRLIDYLLEEYGSDDKVTNLVDNLEIWINPLANPDGTYAGGNNTVSGATRGNANFVDLNRNFPDPDDGPHPDGNEWQEETLLFMELAEDHHFVLSCNLHGGAEVCNYPWDTWSHLSADDDWWEYVCREYADTAQFYSPPGYLTFMNNGITNGYTWYHVAGGRQDYMNYFHQAREFTLEISNTKTPPETQLNNFWNYNYRSLLNYMEQCTFGFGGRVKDTTNGFPVHAEIYVIGHEEDSSWVYSHLPLGNYKRLIHEGNYNIRVSASGYETRLIPNVNVTNRQVTALNIWLTPEGVGNIAQNEISAGVRVYPNPASGEYVNLRSEYVIEHIKVYDMQGRMVHRQSVYSKKASLPAGNLPEGRYVLDIYTDKGRGSAGLLVR